ncbi:MAG: hypothetical protein NC337_13035 [Roseburia sp.]|nr:hypothetical protein [Roseburia sp.]
MNTTQSKISSAGRKMAVILKIGGVLTGIAALLSLLAIGILLLGQAPIRQSFLSAFDVTANNGTTIHIAPRPLLLLFVLLLADTAFLAVILFLVHAIFRDIGKGCTPFTHQNTARIKGIAIAAILLSLVGGCADAFVDYYTIGELTWRVNLVGLISGMAIYCIALIFDYGCDLQRQSDETL